MDAFDHEQLDVYGLAIDFVAKANNTAEGLPRGRTYLVDQLNRASSSYCPQHCRGCG